MEWKDFGELRSRGEGMPLVPCSMWERGMKMSPGGSLSRSSRPPFGFPRAFWTWSQLPCRTIYVPTCQILAGHHPPPRERNLRPSALGSLRLPTATLWMLGDSGGRAVGCLDYSGGSPSPRAGARAYDSGQVSGEGHPRVCALRARLPFPSGRGAGGGHASLRAAA